MHTDGSQLLHPLPSRVEIQPSLQDHRIRWGLGQLHRGVASVPIHSQPS
jgi:hypothetical protein